MSPPLRVAVDLLWLRPGVVGGSETLLVGQLEALARHAADAVDPVLFALPAFPGAHPDLAAALRTVTARISGAHRAVRVVAEATWLFTEARRHRAAVLHAPGGTVPARRPAPTVVTIHDLQYLAYPQHFSTVKLAWLRAAVPAAVRRSAAVATPSEYVRAAVEEAFPFVAGRVRVTPPVVAPRHLDGPPEPDLRARYRVPGPFVVLPAITYPHKGHATVLAALARLAPAHPDLSLVLLGAEGPAEADVRARIAVLGLNERVRRPGRVPDADRDGLIRAAAALAFPSRFEGLGLPVLEAMALGCPVVVAATTALPETAGGAALLVPPDDADAWAAALDRMLTDPAERDRLIAAGRARVAAFTPERTAAALVATYRLALS